MKKAILTHRFEEALVYATRLHACQKRKSTNIPYISHLLAVASLVMEDGGDEDQAVAALLHDAVEDQGGQTTLEEIRNHFGNHVADIVEACSDTIISPKPPWRERKQNNINKIRNEPLEVQRVSLADKLHNARTILSDLRRYGDSTWERFNGGKNGTLWYYHALADIFRKDGRFSMADELALVVGEIERLVQPGE